MVDPDKTVQVPLPPAPPAKSKWITYVAVALGIAGVVAEACIGIGGILPWPKGAGLLISFAGVLTRLVIPAGKKILGLLNGEAIDEGAKARPPSSDEEVEKRMGKK